MRSPILSVILFWVLSLTDAPVAGETLPPSADVVQAAFDRFVQAASQTNCPAELEARETLLSVGPSSFRSLRKPIGITASGECGDPVMTCSRDRLPTTIGLKALSGKSLEDFRGYVYGEGAVVIGGAELSTSVDTLTAVTRKCGRFRAAEAYLAWLKSARPELYGSVAYRPQSRRARASR